MKAANWRKLAQQYLIPSLTELRLAGATMVYGEIGWILHALVVDTSSFNGTRIRLSALNQPLYVPIEGMILTYGEVLRHPKLRHEWWNTTPETEEALAESIKEAIQMQAGVVYANAETPAGLAAYSERRYPDSADSPYIEIEAYSWALAANVPKFMKAVERLNRSVASQPETVTWGKPILDRARLVGHAVEAGPDAVQRLLGEWRDNSIRKYKLQKLTTPYVGSQW